MVQSAFSLILPPKGIFTYIVIENLTHLIISENIIYSHVYLFIHYFFICSTQLQKKDFKKGSQ